MSSEKSEPVSTLHVELRSVKYAAFASQETPCFSAAIFIDGKKAGTAENDGHGGQTLILPPACQEKLAEHAKAVLSEDNARFEPAETLVDNLLHAWLVERDVKRALAKRVLFTKPGSSAVYELRLKSAVALASVLADAALPAKIKADKILNLLPLSEAVKLYKAGTCAA